MTPDPEAVRRALAEIDNRRGVYEITPSLGTYGMWRDAITDHSNELSAAARAWLAQQDGETGDGAD